MTEAIIETFTVASHLPKRTRTHSECRYCTPYLPYLKSKNFPHMCGNPSYICTLKGTKQIIPQQPACDLGPFQGELP